ncbi:MAG: T9SS type A sorting domain-containing protein [Bacteroidetes bacterium]|nr:T9SS type A sorting domain-containing protein [Bacteroidota bacterium]
MKLNQNKISIALIMLLFCFRSAAQLPIIDSLKIIPANPTTIDSVKIICSAYFPSGGCLLSSSSVTITGNTISINAGHILGMMAYICHSTDTITIGKLETGTYELYYHIYDPQNSSISDIDTIFFTVYNITGINSFEKSENDFSIYPNPSGNEIFVDIISHPYEKFNIDIFSVFGQKIKTITDINGKTAIDIDNLAEGAYFIVITNEKKQMWSKKFFKSGL